MKIKTIETNGITYIKPVPGATSEWYYGLDYELVVLGSGLFSHSESEKNDQSQSIYNRQYIRLWLFTVTI